MVVPTAPSGRPMMQEGMHPAMTASMEAVHSFFPKSRLPDGPLTEDDVSLYMLLVTYSDALDALPLEFTRSFSDLRELDAVLGCTCMAHAAHLNSLTHRLQNLAAVIEDPHVSPGERLLALKEVAEEARAYKMGGEDKIRVAVNTAEMYIDSLLHSLTSLPALAPLARESRPRFRRFGHAAPYAPADELLPMPPAGAFPASDAAQSRRARKGAEAAAPVVPPAPAAARTRTRDFSDASRSAKKRKTVPPQAVSNKGRVAIQEPASHDRTTRAPQGAVAGGGKRRGDFRRGWDEGDAESDEGSEAYEPSATSDTRSGVRSRPAKTVSAGSARDDADDQRYCFCNNVSYGDMIGCDDDDCEREWFHLGCVGLSKPPQGTWYCDACLERRTQQARQKAKRGGARPVRAPAAEVVGAPRRVTSGRR